AWLEIDVDRPGWETVRRAVAHRTVHDLVERGRELGLAVAPNVPVPSRAANWFAARAVTGSAPQAQDWGRGPPLVVDLSSLWAGPLCSRLLQRCGAQVIKLESAQRPDGARNGPRAFFELLNAGKRSVVLDFASAQGRAELRALLVNADIVIEGSRPRALRQLGIEAEALIRENPRLTWLSITG